MRWLKHALGIAVCSSLFFLFALWAVSMSLQTFAVGQRVVFTQQQLRNSAVGDACLLVFLAPADLVGLHEREAFAFCALIYGALAYLMMRIVFRRNVARRSG